MRRLALLLLLAPGAVGAGDVTVVETVLTPGPGGWNAQVTLRHADDGWDHYVDAWRLVDERGTVLATRALLHPHVDEQPFTRSLHGIVLAPGLKTLFVEGHDKVHGWGPRVRVPLPEGGQ